MNKKTIAILGTAVLVLSLASVSLAGPMGGGMGMGGGRGMQRQSGTDGISVHRPCDR